MKTRYFILEYLSDRATLQITFTIDQKDAAAKKGAIQARLLDHATSTRALILNARRSAIVTGIAAVATSTSGKSNEPLRTLPTAEKFADKAAVATAVAKLTATEVPKKKQLKV